MRVAVVLVSHSRALAEGLAELAGQMAPDVRLEAVGGLPGGGLGTDFDAVSTAVADADQGAGLVVLYDLGSARMTAELAAESVGDPDRVLLVDAPFVEGAVAAAVAAQNGGELATVGAAAVAAAPGPEARGPALTGPAAEGAVETAEVRAETFVLRNEVGLHARPAALLTRSIAGLDADVRVRFGDGEVDAASVLALMGLGAGRGDTVTVSATGPDAETALRRVTDLVERNFDE
ncbi:HPr family phosphocarrier protein [Actinoalloteichus sp. AHMU CJ021]|uniref:Phosphocarrier protein HPr n=1 Tax=Actinoalloteichus caeruleus DSM 43889 TaxID=1120930 RepID=A0ABT1JND9_ACTCY|nr:dihydroxyacetone kinase phosphoryl donor subunit DhaM [Actinoalloteichus caeruleus]AUS79873.1 HPr family phosphocarrier protein [Actinoalloteichus sp. AHMU CJ021]MCP2334045.1 PTS hybrid protein [Actinoalloteichus caeruleus DSM 43889]